MIMKMPFLLQLKSPVIISTTVGGQNNINTLDQIPGSTLRGVFAARYLQQNDLGDDAHRDEVFRSLFLSGDVRFQSATLAIDGKETSIPLPLNLVREKTPDRRYRDLFTVSRKESLPPYRHPGGFLLLKKGVIMNVAREVNFHLTRWDNPLQGKSLSGGVFTYQGLAADQMFSGAVVGPDGLLQQLYNVAGHKFIARMGRSKTAQYGITEVFLNKPEKLSFPTIEGDTITLMLRTPTVILNGNGFSVTSNDDLIEALDDSINNIKLRLVALEGDVPAIIFRTMTVENYHRRWGMKRWSQTAFAPGSALRVQVLKGSPNDLIKSLLIHGIGWGREDGLGEVIVLDLKEKQLKQLREVAPFSEIGVKRPSEIDVKSRALLKDMVRREVEQLIENLALEDVTHFRGNMPGTLFSRLIGLLEDIDNASDFRNKIEEFRGKKAQDHMERVYFHGKTLFSILVNAPQQVDLFFTETKLGKRLRNHPIVSDLGNLLGIEFQTDDALRWQAWSRYMGRILSQAWLLSKGGGV